MDYDYFLSTYGFPGFFSGMVGALVSAGLIYLLSRFMKPTSESKLLATAFIFLIGTFLISCGAMLIFGFLLPWGSPI